MEQNGDSGKSRNLLLTSNSCKILTIGSCVYDFFQKIFECHSFLFSNFGTRSTSAIWRLSHEKSDILQIQRFSRSMLADSARRLAPGFWALKTRHQVGLTRLQSSKPWREPALAISELTIRANVLLKMRISDDDHVATSGLLTCFSEVVCTTVSKVLKWLVFFISRVQYKSCQQYWCCLTHLRLSHKSRYLRFDDFYRCWLAVSAGARVWGV